MVLWGILAVSLVDNVIRPWAMKEGTEMPAVILFFSILGGIQAFGFVGMLLGPLVFVLLAGLNLFHVFRTNENAPSVIGHEVGTRQREIQRLGS